MSKWEDKGDAVYFKDGKMGKGRLMERDHGNGKTEWLFGCEGKGENHKHGHLTAQDGVPDERGPRWP